MSSKSHSFWTAVLSFVCLGASLAVPAAAQVKIMPLGDSITRGVSGPSTDDAGYRNDLAGFLDAEGVTYDFVGSLSDGTGFDSDHEGHGGFRADQILSNLGSYLSANPDIVILHIGTNDISSDQTAVSTRDEIEDIVDAIFAANGNAKVILSSVIPRADDKDDETTALNTQIEDLFYLKRDQQGKAIFYAGVNELFKLNANWATAYFGPSDDVHPNDAGFAVMGEAYLNAVTTALNAASAEVTDNFERDDLGIFWDADPQFEIQTGDLVNTATTGASRWEYLATYTGVKNPGGVAVKWAADADVAGIDEGGLAVLLDAPSRTADGYLGWISPGNNELHLWTVTNGSVDQDLLDVNPTSLTGAPGPGKVTRIETAVDADEIRFDYYVEDVFAGSITIDNPGLSGERYAGILLRHDRNNDVAEFTLFKQTDTNPPAAVDDLVAEQPTTSSLKLYWTAPGDDGDTGQASSYDVRVSTQSINDGNFDEATAVLGLPNPSVSGATDSVLVTGLSAGTQYFFALKTTDEAGNVSELSNQATAITPAGNGLTDNFNRTTGLGANWAADPAYAIVNNRLSNQSTDGLWNDIAVLNSRKNPAEVSFTFGDNTNAAGIDQAGFVVVFDSSSATSSGYAVTRRTIDNSLRLWRLVNGTVTDVIDRVNQPLQSAPTPGDVVKIQITSDGTANKFDFFINGVFDGRVEDTAFEQDLAEDYWAGVTLRSNLSNDIDDFTVLLEIGEPANMFIVGGDAQVDTVGKQLPIPLSVQVVDDNDSPVAGVNVDFEVIEGGGSVDVSQSGGDIVIEAEAGAIHAPMVVIDDAGASNGKYIEVPNGSGGNGSNLGTATYTVNIEEAGDYVIWGRAIYPDAENDAFRILIGSNSYLWDVGQRDHQSDWHWDQASARGTGSARNPQFDPLILELDEGPLTIVIQESKDGTKLDQLVITPAGSDFEPPADQSPVESGGVFTNADGIASANLTLGQTPGLNRVRASLSGLFDVTFTATGLSRAIETITKVSGDNQVGQQGQPLAQPFVVELRDEDGNPAAGSEVNFTVLAPGNGTLSTTNPVIADASGRASTTLTMATNTAVNQVKVTSPTYTGPDVIFNAFIPSGDPKKVELASGNNQTGTAGSPLSAPFVVRVTDDSNVPISGYAVTFRVLDGGGKLTGGVTTQQVVTGALGTAQTTLTLGPTGGALNRIDATAQGLTGSPVIFSANAAVPQTLQAVSELSLEGTANLPLSDSVRVRVKDAIGGNLPNQDVIFTVLEGGGLVNNSAQIVVKTQADGVARVEWRLGANAGNNNNKLRAESSYNGAALSGSPVAFTGSAIAGSAANLTSVSGNNQMGVVSQPLGQPFVVSVTESDDDPVANWPVLFEVTAGEGNLSGASSQTVYTNAQGQARATLTLGPNVGSNNNTVRVSSPQTGNQTFTASAQATAATKIALVDGNGQTGQAGLPLAKKVKVKLTDDSDKPVAGQVVTFRVIEGGGSINDVSAGDTVKFVTSNQNGIGEVTWFMGGVLGSNNQKLSVTANNGLADLAGSPISVTATATTGPADPAKSTVKSDKSALQANGQERATITVTLLDKFANPVAGKMVTLSSDHASDNIVQPTAQTDQTGKTQGTIAGTAAGEHIISAQVVGGVQPSNPVHVVFLSTPPASISLSSGNEQTGNVGTVLAQPIQVVVQDAFNNPVPGITVTFDVTDGDGFIVPADGESPGSPVEKITNSNGVASANWVLGPDVGSNSAEAVAIYDSSPLDGSPVAFSATGQNTTPQNLDIFAGNNQTSGAGSQLSEPLQVKVTDAVGGPVANVDVEFEVIAGGGSVNITETSTNYAGVAQTWLQLGPEVGTNRVRARATGISGQPAVVFDAESLTGTPSRMTRVAGHNASVTVNQTHDVSVLVADLNDNPIGDVAVHFAVVSGGATIANPDFQTTAQGLAMASVKMPTTAGQVVVRATSELLPDFYLDFLIQAVAGPATMLAIFDGNSQNGTVGKPLVAPLRVKVSDQFGNGVSGRAINWSTGSGMVTPTSSTTNAQGIAATSFTISSLGANTAQATASGLTGSPAIFTATGVSNNFPEFVNLTDHQVSEGNLLFFEVIASDADGDPVTYGASNLPTGANLNGSTGAFTWTATDGQTGEYQVTFTADDGKGGFDSETITITVSNDNNVPLITQFAPVETEMRFILRQVIVFSVTATDADDDDLAYTWRLRKGLNGQAQEVSEVSTYVWDTSQYSPASYTIQVTVTDGKDEITQEWKIDVVTTVELSSFTAQFADFDGVNVAWETSREVNNTGFNILRSPTETGDYTKINEKLIASVGKGAYSFRDYDIEVGRRYYYKLQDVDVNGTKTEHGPVVIDIAAPNTFELSQNYPNPFNPDTKIRFQLPEAERVVLKVFDVLGREVVTLVDERREAGFFVVTWNGRDNLARPVSSGIYYYQIVSGEFRQTRKMLLVK